jgi:hypothetical protein
MTSGRTAGEVDAAPAITGRIEGLAGVGLTEPRGVRAVCPCGVRIVAGACSAWRTAASTVGSTRSLTPAQRSITGTANVTWKNK